MHSGGADIHLYESGGQVVGSTAATLAGVTTANTVFSLAVDSSTGVVTLTQNQAIDHSTPGDTAAPYDTQLAALSNGLVTLNATATITDSDGDKATSTQHVDLGGNIQFADDGPSITLNATNEAGVLLTTHDALTIGAASDTAHSTANFSGVFTVGASSYGADGAGTTATAYSLNLATGVLAGADSGLHSGGADIHLYESGGQVVGSTAATLAGVTTANTVFSLAVDSSTGVVTLTQNQAIDHSTPGDTAAPYDTQLAALSNGLVTLNATATITDSDGDKATSTQHVDLGGNIQFADDGPSITLNATNEASVLLTTHDALTIGAASDTAHSTANFSGVFTVGASSYGADGPGTTATAYSLNLATGVLAGADSGLHSGGADIHLYERRTGFGSTAATLAGVTTANTVFSLAVDGSTGVVTLTQNQAIDHSTPGDTAAPYDTQLAALSNGLVTLNATATITDSDGDKATSTQHVDFGGNIQFADDGPSITLNATNEAGVLLTTHDALTIGAASDTAHSTANFSGVFTVGASSYGADGAGTTATAYSLDLATGVLAGADSGLHSGGADIHLYAERRTGCRLDSGNACRRDTANTVFSLAVDSSTGVVTLTQNQAIDHSTPGDTAAPYDTQLAALSNGLVTLNATATITDSDGDKATSTQHVDLGGNIQFADDGPSITLNATNEAGVLLTTHDALTIGAASDTAHSTANFSGVFTVGASSYGADGAGTTATAYSLNLATGVLAGADSGLHSGGADIHLYESGGQVVGSTAATLAGVTTANTVFSLAVDSSTGVVTLTQNQAIDHSTPGDTAAPYDTQLAALSNGLVTLNATATITDSDGDKATSTQHVDLGGNIQFADDGPSITLNATNEAGVLLTTHDALTIGAASDTAHSTANFSGVFTVGASSYGADGAGTTATAYSLNLATGVLAGADSGLHSGGADIHLYESGGQVVGSTAATLAGVTTANTVFSLAVDSSTGVVTLTQNQAIDHSTPGDTAAPYDTQLAALSNGLVTLNATATITDSDGDKATSTQHVDLGGNIQFADDGPSITLNATNEAGVLLTTHDALTIGAASDTAHSTANFSGVFTVGASSYGADGAGTTATAYSLNLATGVLAGADSGLHSGGADIHLYESGGQVVGSTAATLAGVTTANTVFSLAVDSSTGVVTLTQNQAIDHSTPGDTAAPYDTQLAALSNGLVTLNATATITDSDGDKATSTQHVDLGGNIQFADDGPSITLNATNEAGVLLTTHDALTIGAASDTAHSTANFSGVFTVGASSYGADGAGTTATAYSLNLATGVLAGADSGLHSGGADIHLYESGGQVVGSTAATLAGVTTANTVFSLAVDSSTGVVTLTQNQAIDHSTPGDTAAPYDTQLAALSNGLVTLNATATITDSDGDKATSTQHVDLGGNIQFADDGPSITLNATNEAGVLLTTHDALTIGAASDTAHSTANFSGVFTVGASSYGADGAGTTATAYSLNLATGVLAGADSGLHSGGADIHLYESGGQVVGSTAATLAGVTTANTVFSLAVDSSTGVVTLTQNQAIDHSTPGDTAAPYDTQLAALSNGLVTLNATATITDSDGDKATSTQHVDLGGNIQFADDGPSITLNATNEAGVLLTTHDALTIGAASDTAHSTANFSGVFTVGASSYGADGAGTTATAYSLNLATGVLAGADSGLHSGGADIHLYESGGQVVGSTAATLAGVTTANTVFSLAVDSSTGVVTLTQNQAIDHSTPGDTAAPYDTQLAALSNGLVTLNATATITDSDGDKATSTQHVDLGGNIQFADDGPSITLNATNEAGVLLTTHDALTIGAASDTAHSTANFSGVFTVGASSYGADGAGTTATAYSLNLATGVLAGADSGLHSGGADIHLYESGGQVVGSTAATLAGVTTANTVFSLAVDSSTGVVTLTQNQAIDHSTPGDTAAPYDTQLAALSNGLVTLNATATITDSDGDKATSTQHVDLGGNIQFADDGPSITLNATNEAGVLLTKRQGHIHAAC